MNTPVESTPRRKGRPGGKMAAIREFCLSRRASRILMMQFLYSCESRKDWTQPDEEACMNLLELFTAVDTGFLPFMDDAQAARQDAPPDDEMQNPPDGTPSSSDILAAAYARLVKCLPALLNALPELDRLIVGAAENWSLDRMVSLDRNILRVAVFEMLHDGISPAIAINEAIELAKVFGEHDSPRFINGVLDRIRKQINTKD